MISNSYEFNINIGLLQIIFPFEKQTPSVVQLKLVNLQCETGYFAPCTAIVSHNTLKETQVETASLAKSFEVKEYFEKAFEK